MIKEFILDKILDYVYDIGKEKTKQHRSLNTSFLVKFKEAMTIALEQLYEDKNEGESKWNSVVTDISNHYFQGKGRFDELSEESQSIINRIIEILSNKYPNALAELSFINNEHRFDNIEEKLDLLKQSINKGTDNNTILFIIKDLLLYIERLITDLHLDYSQNLLKELRKILIKQQSLDYKVLFRLDYYKSLCSYYIAPLKWHEEIEDAYNEMLLANEYDIDVVSHFIYSTIKIGKREKAIKLANELKIRERNCIYAWMPELIYSESKKATMVALPNEIKNSVKYIASLYFANVNVFECFNYNNIDLSIPNELSYDNLEEWLFKFIFLYTDARRTSQLDFRCIEEIPPKYIKVINMSDKLLKFLEGKGCHNWIPDVKWINAYLHFVKEKDIKWIYSFDKIKPSKLQEESYKIHKILLLIADKKYEEAKSNIMKIGQLDQEGVVDIAALFIYQFSVDSELALKAFNLRIASKMPIQTGNIHFFIRPIIDNPDVFAVLSNQLVFEDEKIVVIIDAISHFFLGDKDFIKIIEQNEENIPEGIKYIVAQIYRNNDSRDQAIKLVTPTDEDIKTNSPSLNYYISLLRESSNDSLQLLSILKKIRNSGMYEKDYLMCEAALYFKRSEFNDAYTVMTILWENYSDDNSIFLDYLVALWKTNRVEQINKLQSTALSRTIEAQYIKGIYNVFITAGFPETAIELLYKGINEHPYSQDLKDIYALECLAANPIATILHTGKSVVSENDYVQIEEDGEKKNIDAIKGSSYEALIGKGIGDIVRIEQFNGILRSLKIIFIFNKYYKLSQTIMEENEKGQSKALLVFNVKDMDGGQIWDKIIKYAGDPNDRKVKREERTERYKKGTLPLINMMSTNSTIISFYDFIFGNEFKYITPMGDFLKRIGAYDITNNDVVLDITSLILISELHKRLSFTFPKKFVVPNGLVDYIKISIDNESVRQITSVSQEAFNNLFLSNYSGNTKVEKMKELLTWVNTYCITETAEDITKIPQKLDFLLRIESECLLIANKPNRIMLSEDNGMINVLSHLRIISTETFISLLFPSHKNELSHYLANLHFININLSSDYIVSQYWQRMNNKGNTFLDCLKTIEGNRFIAGEVIGAATQILLSGIILESTLMTIQNMFICMFKGISFNNAQKIINLYRSYPLFVPAILTALDDAFMIVYQTNKGISHLFNDLSSSTS